MEANGEELVMCSVVLSPPSLSSPEQDLKASWLFPRPEAKGKLPPAPPPHTVPVVCRDPHQPLTKSKQLMSDLVPPATVHPMLAPSSPPHQTIYGSVRKMEGESTTLSSPLSSASDSLCVPR
jgi:hypothetical protein